MAEKTAEERLADLEGHHKGVMESLTTLQNKLDDQLQKRKDDAAAHEAAIAALKAEHEAATQKLSERFAQELAKHTEAHEKAMQQQESALCTKHAAEVAKLKETVLVPALRDFQQRQAADLAAKHAAEIDALK